MVLLPDFCAPAAVRGPRLPVSMTPAGAPGSVSQRRRPRRRPLGLYPLGTKSRAVSVQGDVAQRAARRARHSNYFYPLPAVSSLV